MILYPEIESILQSVLKPGVQVLEIGGKKGGYLSSRTDIDLIVSNIDSSVECDVIVDACDIPFEDNKFDLIFMVAADYFIDNLDKALSEVDRVTKEDGKLIIFSYKEKTLRRLKEINKQKYNIETTAYSTEEYNHKFEQVGFKSSIRYLKNDRDLKGIKNIVQKLLPGFIKEMRSPWKVYICEKS